MIIRKFFKDYVSQRFPKSKILKDETSVEYKIMEEAFMAGLYTLMEFMDKQSANPDLATAAKNLARIRTEMKTYASNRNYEIKIQNRS